MDGMTARVANAGPAELLVITYELAIDSIESAISNLSDDKKFKRYINKSQSLISELMKSLNMSYEISLDLMSLYLFVNKAIIKGFVKKDAKSLEDAKKVLGILKSGWDKATETKKSEHKPVINNSQKLVAGLTYGRGTLNESVMNNGSNRGFKA